MHPFLELGTDELECEGDWIHLQGKNNFVKNVFVSFVDGFYSKRVEFAYEERIVSIWNRPRFRRILILKEAIKKAPMFSHLKLATNPKEIGPPSLVHIH